MAIVKKVSRDNARTPIDHTQYKTELATPTSTLNFYTQIIRLWRTDPTLIHGTLRVQSLTKSGILNFTRTYKTRTYSIHLDFTLNTPSTLTNHLGQILLTNT
jgi:glycosidase